MGAMIGLAKGRYGPVVADQVCAAQLAVVLLFDALRHVALVDALVVMLEYSRNVDPVGTWHAVLAVVAVDGRIIGHDAGKLCSQELLLLGGDP